MKKERRMEMWKHEQTKMNMKRIIVIVKTVKM